MAEHDIEKIVEAGGEVFNFRDPTKQPVADRVTSWSSTPSDTKYPSEKLVKDSLDGIAGDYRTKLQDASKGGNLVVNGNGVLGTNYNFGARTFIGNTDLPNGNAGCFHAVANTIWHDEPIAVDVSKTYEAEVWYRVKSSNTSTVRFSACCFDVDGLEILSIYCTFGVGTLTELTQDLKPGDTVVHLADLSGDGWLSETNYHHGFIFWNYQNSLGYTYPQETYSRNVYPTGNVYLWDDSSAVNVAAGTITLKSAWKGPTIPAGTKVSRRNSGVNYYYVDYTQTASASTSWEKLSGKIFGTVVPGSASGGAFRPGTAFLKIGFYNSNTTTNEYIEFTGMSLRELPAKIATARKLKTNLARTADSTFDGSADQTNIPVTGTLPVGNGGTGKASVTSGNYVVGAGTSAMVEKTPKDVGSDVLSHLDTDNGNVVDDDYIVGSYHVNETTISSTLFVRRTAVKLWNYIKSKLSGSDVNIGGNASTATKATQDSDGSAINTSYKKLAESSKFTEPQWIDNNTRTSYNDLRIGNSFKLLSLGISGGGNLLLKELAGGRTNSPTSEKSILYTLNGGTEYFFNGKASTADTAAALADDSAYVHKSGSETISGTKKFTAAEVNSDSSSGTYSGFFVKRTAADNGNKVYRISLEVTNSGSRGVYDYGGNDYDGDETWIIRKTKDGDIKVGESTDKVYISGKCFDFSGTIGSDANTFYLG